MWVWLATKLGEKRLQSEIIFLFLLMLNFTETAFYLALYLWSNNLIVHTLVFFWNDDDFVIEHSILQKTPYISAGVCVSTPVAFWDVSSRLSAMTCIKIASHVCSRLKAQISNPQSRIIIFWRGPPNILFLPTSPKGSTCPCTRGTKRNTNRNSQKNRNAVSRGGIAV